MSLSTAVKAGDSFRLQAGALRERLFLAGGLVTLALIAIVALGLGAMPVSWTQVLQVLLPFLPGAEIPDAMTRVVVLDIRLPRVAMAMLVGAGLAICGAAMQGLFRNPLADPGLIGVSAGAALGAVSWIVLASSLGWLGSLAAVGGALGGQFALAVAAFLGGLATTLVVYAITLRAGRMGATATLLLAGIAVSALCGAATGLLTYVADDAQLRSVTFWSMGSLGGSDWHGLAVLALLIVPASIALWRLNRVLDALLLGEESAGHLGFDLARIRPVLIVLVALVVGSAVGLTGMIGFVGLMAPHIARMMIGPGHRLLMPMSMVVGAILLLAADSFARTVATPAEIPIGIVTTLLGGPFFLYLLLRRFG
ncbi:MAG: FecCD family ABC transporter permease [Halothiobacillaceae bacterium]